MNELIERLRASWASLAPREQRIVAIGIVLGGLILFYAAIWDPVMRARAERAQQLANARALAERIEKLAALAPASAPSATANRNLSLLAAVDQAIKSSQLGKAPSRIQPEGERQVRVWFEDVPFDRLVRWLSDLQSRYGVQVESADIERESGPGLVNARLSLVRP